MREEPIKTRCQNCSAPFLVRNIYEGDDGLLCEDCASKAEALRNEGRDSVILIRCTDCLAVSKQNKNASKESECGGCIAKERDQFRADLADARQKLAEAQADCAAKADALRVAEAEAAAMVQALLRFQEWKKQGRILVVSKVIEDLLAAALAPTAGDALVKELARLREELRVTHEIAERDSDEKWNLAAQRDAANAELERLRAENMGRDAVDKELLCPSEFQTATGHFDPAGYDPNDCAGCGCKRKDHKTAKERALRAQRDQAVLLARELGSLLQGHLDTHGAIHADDEPTLAKLAALNPPPSDDTLKV